MIPLTKPSITSREVVYVDRAITRGDLGRGEYVELFEKKWASFNNKNYGVSCSSGSAALYLALRALGVGPGDEVIVPDFTSVSCGAAVKLCGAEPMFVDCRQDLLMNPELLQHAVNPRTKAIMVVAIYGRTVPQEIFDFAKEAGLPVIEDLAEAHGIQPRGHIACYSFYGNKILTTGEGGMCLTAFEDIALELRECANFYFDKERTNTHRKLGWNFRMTNLQAAVGYAQVERARELIDARRQVAQWYDARLPHKFLTPARDVDWLYDIVVPDARVYKAKLDAAGIESRHFFKPLHTQAAFPNAFFTTRAVGDELYTRGLLLPLFADMTEQQVDEVCQVLIA